jgi:SAM-dependent methyltransferase
MRDPLIDRQTLEVVALQHLQEAYPRARDAEIRARVQGWLDQPARGLEAAADLLRHAGSIDGLDLLDLGCMMGLSALTFARLGARVSGVDTDPRLIDIARRLSGGAPQRRTDGPASDPAGSGDGISFRPPEFASFDGRTLPFPDSRFDAAYSLSTFERMPRPERLLAEVSRVLRPGGCFVLEIPNRLFPYDPHTRLWGAPWLPLPAADAWARLRGRTGLTEQGIRFYSYVSLVRLVRDTRLPLRVVLPEPGPAAPAASIRRWLGVLRLRPALLASRLRLILEKDGRTTESGFTESP